MNERLWQRVEAALDARRDPLKDEALRADLAREPETRAAVERLLRRLEHLPDATRPDVRSGARAGSEPGARRLPRFALAAAALLALATAGLLAVAARARHASLADLAARPTPNEHPGVSLVVETTRPKATRAERVVLENRHVLTWNLEER